MRGTLPPGGALRSSCTTGTLTAHTLWDVTPSTVPAEERQVNLLLALRNTTSGLTASQIIDGVNGYNPDAGQSARRMFERDKDVLRSVGVPLLTQGAGEECRYRVDEEAYALPPLSLDGAVAAALDLAASAWRDGSLPLAAQRALTKLRAVSTGEDRHTSLPDLTVDLGGDQVPAHLATAVDQRRRVAFDYASGSSGTLRRRHVEPHALRLAGGAWYLDGYDRDARARRTFRLARVRGQVEVVGEPGAFEAPAPEAPRTRTAVLRVRDGQALTLRMRATDIQAAAGPGGEDVVTVPYEDDLAFAGTLASLGPAVVVLEPADLRDAVRAHLQAVSLLAPSVQEA